MPLEVDTTKWSGEGTFTQVLIDCLREVPGIAAIRVEDARASRSDADYNFVSNEVFVAFARKLFVKKAMTLRDLESILTGTASVGAPDYSDGGMLQYLKTERIIPPYQTRGYKLVELVRLYEVGTPSRV
jgi:hypothetical protein